MSAENLRVRKVSSAKGGRYVLYLALGAFRVSYNPSLCFAISLANKLHLPLIVLVVIDFSFPTLNGRNFKFFIEGLQDFQQGLTEKKIGFHLMIGSIKEIFSKYYGDAGFIVTDVSYLPEIRNRQKEIYSLSDAEIYEVDSNLLVPVWIASNKRELGAYTLRPKIMKIYRNFMKFEEVDYRGSNSEDVVELSFDELMKKVAERFGEVLPETPLKGGEVEAKRILRHFLNEKFHRYAELRSNPAEDVESKLSPYLHFGCISPLEILKEAAKIDCDPKNFDVLFEQIIVRRELAHNFTYYSYKLVNISDFLPEWAYQSLKMHSKDHRPYLYSLEEFENARTHDPYWNAAQKELIYSGKIHNYMRMYWGKKIIEWTESPEIAYNIMCYLNNKYALDGWDPNSYAGIGWCFGLHDRPFRERPVFGKVRYMSEKGLLAKFEMEKYLQRISLLGG
jgi:deoxyribodipyrimidine photo-lyase